MTTRRLDQDGQPGADAGEAGAYFDNNATTPLDPRVRDVMLPWFGQHHGNPSSAHRYGRAAKEAIETARAQVATLIGGRPSELVFVSSGSEANNAVIYAVAQQAPSGGRILYSSLEHPSVRVAIKRVAALRDSDSAGGIEAVELQPDVGGVVTAEQVATAISDSKRPTLLACVMHANNELGTIQPIADIAAVCRQHDVPLLCDAVQTVGKVEVDVGGLGVDYLTLGGHKFHAPPGIAALWLRDGASMQPLVVGANQEHGLRASTENVPAIVGLGHAAELARDELASRERHLVNLRDRFENGLDEIAGTHIHCRQGNRLPHTTHVAFDGISGHELMVWLDARGFAVSTGSACHSGKPQPSRVLLHMGLPEAEALASLRVSFGMTNGSHEVDALLVALAEGVPTLRMADSGPA